jgi:hypothetical protein
MEFRSPEVMSDDGDDGVDGDGGRLLVMIVGASSVLAISPGSEAVDKLTGFAAELDRTSRISDV